MNKKALYFILILFCLVIVFDLRIDSLSQETPSEESSENKAVVCLNTNPNLRHPCYLPEGVPVFETIEEAHELLAPDGSGMILINRGIYTTNITLEGNWVIRGTDFPSEITIIPRDRSEIYYGSTRDNREAPAAFTVEIGSTLRLENVTIYDDVSALDPPRVFDPTLALTGPAVAAGVVVKGLRSLRSGDEIRRIGATATLNNVNFAGFLDLSLVVQRGASAIIRNTDFSCHPNGIIDHFIYLAGDFESHDSKFDHCNIWATDSFGNFTFINNSFNHSILVAVANVVLQNNRFRNSRDFVKNNFQVVLTANAVLSGNIFENVQDNDLPFAQDFESIEFREGFYTLQNNQFIGFDRVALINDSVRGLTIDMQNNEFRNNKTVFEFDYAKYSVRTVFSNHNAYLDNECVFSIPETPEFVEIIGKSNTFKNNQQITCPEEFELPEGFISE